jgi:hypothetical protein
MQDRVDDEELRAQMQRLADRNGISRPASPTGAMDPRLVHN